MSLPTPFRTAEYMLGCTQDRGMTQLRDITWIDIQKASVRKQIIVLGETSRQSRHASYLPNYHIHPQVCRAVYQVLNLNTKNAIAMQKIY